MQKRLMRTCAAIRAARDRKRRVKVIKPFPTPKEEEVNVREGAIVILCNPVLDVLTPIDPDYLQQYEIGSMESIIAEEKHMPIFEEVHNMKPKPKYEGGGSGLNTARVLQAILKKPNVSIFFGSIGKDENAGYLQQAIRHCGVNMTLQDFEEEPTATCVVLITGLNRAKITNVGAAKLMTDDFLTNFTNNEMLSDGDIYYITGFFFSLHPEKTKNVMQIAVDRCKTIAFNLSADYICLKFVEQIDEIMPNVDILFANESEARNYVMAKDWECDTLADMAKRIQSMPKTSLKPRLVIITRGPLPIFVAYDGFVTQYPVRPMKRSEIIDRNSSGDAFVGGFLSQYVQNMPLQFCIRCGIWAAALILQRSGCGLQNFPNYKRSCK